MQVISASGFSPPITEVTRIAVANSIARVVHDLIPGDPPMGNRPIELLLGNPIVLWSAQDYNAKNYRVRINTNDAKWMKFAYELGHELGHVKFGTARSNVLIEVFAMMTSFATVKRIGKVWQEKPPFKGDWSMFASTTSYMEETLKIGESELPESIRDNFLAASPEEKAKRLASVRPGIEKLKIVDMPSRGFQKMAAHLILEAEQHHWKDLLGVAMHTNPSPSDSIAYTADLPLLADKIPDWVPEFLR